MWNGIAPEKIRAAMKAIGKDRKLANFYERVRKRSSRHIARVAVARKLAEICWIRLRRWHREQHIKRANGRALDALEETAERPAVS